MARILSGPYVSVRVVAKQTGTPISGVTVTVSPAVYTTVEMTSSTTSLTTNGDGVSVCYALPGTYTFTTTAVDAAPIEPVEILGAEGLGADRTTTAAVSDVGVNVELHGVLPSNSSAANKAALQALLDTIATGPALFGSRKLLFPSTLYEVDAGLVINTSSVEFAGGYGGLDAGDSTSQTKLNFHFGAVGGAGTAIAIGTDSGNPYDSNEYNGHSGTRFRRLRIAYGGGATTETALVNLPARNYGVACYGVRDWRGGAIVAEDLEFAQFDRGFWGVQSDLNVWYRARATDCNVGYYIDARSDQNTFYDFFPYGNDSAVTVDGAHGTRFYSASFVGNGSLTTNSVNLRAAYSRGCVGTLFEGCWFEQLQRADTINASLSIGGFGTYQVTGVRIINPIILCNGAGNGPHIKYFIELNNCDDITLDNPSGQFGIPVEYFLHVSTGNNYSPHVFLRLAQALNSHTILLNEGTGAPLLTEYVAGNGDMIFRASNPRVRVVSEPAQVERDYYIDAPSDSRWVVAQPARADGNTLFLDYRRRFIDGGAAPLSGTWIAGDFVRNQSATAGSTFGWRCVAGGTPGTWETLTFATSGGASTTASGIYGDGSDGALAFDGTTTVGGLTRSGIVYTAVRDLWTTTTTVSGGYELDMAGFRLYATTSVTVSSGKIRRDGNAGSGATAGAVLAAATVGGGTAGGAGGAGTTGTAATSATVSLGAAGGAGGLASGGGTGGGPAGGAFNLTAGNSQPRALGQAQSMKTTADGSSGLYKGGQGGGGGTAAASSTGGGGGSGGGIVWIAAPTITLNASGTVSAKGGDGGAASGAGTGAGGGGGGGGGVIVLVYHTLTNSGTLTVAGGGGGALQGAGAAGAAGSTGTIYQVVN